MKKIIQLVVLCTIMASCGSQSGNKDVASGITDSTAMETATENKIIRLDPASVDVNKPIDAIEANAQIDCWDGKKIEVAGYGFVFYGDSLETKSGITLTDSAGGKKYLFDCRFVNPPAVLKIAKTDKIHIRGNINGNFNGSIIMDSCEIIVVAKSISTQSVDPFGKGVMDATALSADYFKWEGKEIAVVGDYYMTTTSTTSYGITIRVDLKNSATNDKVVGCDFKVDPSERISGNEKGVIIKGKIKTYTPYGYLMLEECVLVNR
ncbi:MAG: hypothetical protein IPQ06_12950 [Chitinophagaceae bacterium]|nr:hypothetical protein [Chitinophagaceae bacterium]MBL0273943.1 hypothetical protein [Chitinophagaceae bacterium]